MAKPRKRQPARPPRAIGLSRPPGPATIGNSRRTSAALLAGIAVVGVAIVLIGVAIAASGPGREGPSPTFTNEPGGSASPTAGMSASGSFGAPTADALGGYPTIDGVSCDSLEHTDFHVHAHLTIRIAGQSQTVPANIGISESCFYWLHTHTDSGIVHVEAPADAELTLGTFFDIWGQPLTSSTVADWAAGAGQSVYAFVNGEPYTGDPRTIRLKDLEIIELQIGISPLDPLPYEFPPDFR